MSGDHAGDMIEAGAYSVDELREAVFEGTGPVARPLALALLSRKDYPEKVADLQSVLMDEQEAPRLRVLAAAALGQTPSPAAVRALERGLQARESTTLRGVAKALANVGTRKHVTALEELARNPGPVGTEARRSLGVLTERLKAESPVGRAPERTVPVTATGKPTRIRVEKAVARDVNQIAKTLPSRKLASRAAIAMTCQGRRLVFAFDADSLGRGMAMFRRRGEVGIVAEPRKVEGSGWEPRYRVAVEPEPEGAFRVRVTTLDGRPVLAGSGKVEGRTATFHVGAADAPGALPVEISGRFDGRQLILDQARSAVRRRPSRLPAPAQRAPR